MHSCHVLKQNLTQNAKFYIVLFCSAVVAYIRSRFSCGLLNFILCIYLLLFFQGWGKIFFIIQLILYYLICHLQTPLHLSVYLEQPRVVQALVLKGVNTAVQDRNGNTPLHLACEQQNLECVQLLLLLQETTSDENLEARKCSQNLQIQNWQGEKK